MANVSSRKHSQKISFDKQKRNEEGRGEARSERNYVEFPAVRSSVGQSKSRKRIKI